ncbi:MAG TPA: hemerythrin domain-containing protein [Acidimicrobiia bacterium]|nr:hemerythrin domain-containing protein [Acidimicrobiia bacterium]
MEPLRNEHAALVPHIDALRTTADLVGVAPAEELRALADESFEFLVHHLIPHATAEEEVLYPAVERAMGTPGATATMSRDHVAVDRLTHELGQLRSRLAGAEGVPDELARGLRRVLYGLYALVMVHFAKEEEIYVPLLEAHLTAGQAAELLGRMEAAAGAAPGH